MVLATVAAFAALVFVLPRFSAGRPQAVLARASMLLVLNMLVLLTSGVALNDEYGFFADWTDLRGALFGGQAAVTTHAGADPQVALRPALGSTSTAVARAAPSAAPALPIVAIGSDHVLRFTVTGPASGLTGSILVTLPSGYLSPANRFRRYPVLETFPGYPGTPSEWTDYMNLGGLLATAAQQRTIGPVIIVSPSTEFPPGVDTECVDGTGRYPRVETWLTQDVPRWVMRNFRASLERTSWATIGLSVGGWCAAMATMLHPDQYAAGIVMGGYFAPDFPRGYQPYPRNSALAYRYNLVALAEHRPPPVALWLETSHSDGLSYPSSARLLSVARSPLSLDVLALTHAGHRMSLWISELPMVIRWLGRSIPGFAP
jgi:hypothetical protein